MISNRKLLIRSFELIAIGWALAGIVLASLAYSSIVSPEMLRPYVLVEFMGFFPIFFVALLLIVEFSGVVRAEASWWGKRQGLSWLEVKQLVQWCPASLLVPFVVVQIASLACSFLAGRAHWGSGQPFTEHHAIVFSLGAVLFCIFSAPVLASASRMPGSYAEHFTSARRH